MSLVYGHEQTTSRSYFSFFERVTATQDMMATSKAPDRKKQNDITRLGPSSSSSPPIDIIKPKATIQTPPNSFGSEPKTPSIIQMRENHTFKGVLPLTPGDDLLEKAKRKSDPMLQELLEDPRTSKKTKRVLNNFLASPRARERWAGLDEDVLMELRAYKSHSFVLKDVDQESFTEWDDILSDMGGYEYDARLQELIIKAVPGPLHDGVAVIFQNWFGDIERDLADQEIKLRFRPNQGKALGGDHIGDKKISDCMVLVNNKPSIVLEIGVSQGMSSLMDSAKKWLRGSGVKLVILVNIKVSELDEHKPGTPLSDSINTDRSSQNLLPYELAMNDLTSRDPEVLEIIGQKIISWYRNNDPSRKLVEAKSVTIYLYRRHPSIKNEITSEPPIALFEKESGGWAEVAASIKASDFGLSDSFFTEDSIKLPLNVLRAKFKDLLEEQASHVAEEMALQLIKDAVGLKDPEYINPPENGPNSPTTSIKTCSSSRKEGNAGKFQQQPTSIRSQRKRNAESFTAESLEASSEGTSDDEMDELAFSNPSSFTKPQDGKAGTVSQSLRSMVDEPGGCGQPSRQRSTKRRRM